MAPDPQQDHGKKERDYRDDELHLEERRERIQELRKERAERNQKIQKRKRVLLLFNFVILVGTVYYFLAHYQPPTFYKTVNRTHDGTGLRLSVGRSDDGDYLFSFAVTNRTAALRNLAFNGGMADFRLTCEGVDLERQILVPETTNVTLKPGEPMSRSMRIEKWRFKRFAEQHSELVRRTRVLLIPLGRPQLPLRAEVQYRLAGAPVLRIDFEVDIID